MLCKRRKRSTKPKDILHVEETALASLEEARRTQAAQRIGHARSGRTLTIDATLILENSNPHDENAVRVEIDGALIGYLSRENAPRYRTDLAAAGASAATVRCQARIVGGFETATGERANFGVRLDLPPMEARA